MSADVLSLIPTYVSEPAFFAKCFVADVDAFICLDEHTVACLHVCVSVCVCVCVFLYPALCPRARAEQYVNARPC